jgi:thiosulfate dehydrogenase (quinone) large subunit
MRSNPGAGPDQAPPPGIPTADAQAPSLREQWDRASLAYRALLPMRFFFGVTFVYAGIDKLVDPTFFDAANPASIVAQLAAFTRVSPLAPLIRPMEPFAIPIGLLIALAEIAIGIGALTGLAYRLAAAGGAALSLLFWLTASWSTHPYYYGPDLPYAFGWLALAIAGHGRLLVPRAVLELGTPHLDAWDRARATDARGGRRPRLGTPELDPEAVAARRFMVQVGVLAAVSLVVASFAVPLRLFRGSGPATTGLASRTGGTSGSSPAATGATPAATLAEGPSAADTPAAGATAAPFTPSGLTVASTAAVDAKGAVRIRVPADAPASLPAGDPGIIVKLADGTYAAYDAVCTHEGCKVGWDAQDGVMLCPCHGAAFDPNDHGAVLQGPTNTPLPELPIIVDQQAGTITLKG